MSTKTDQTSSPAAAFTVPSVEEATQSMKDIGERWIESSKSAGLVSMDAYEKAVTSVTDFEKKMAENSDNEWVSTLAATHAKALTALTSSYTTVVRDLLK